MRPTAFALIVCLAAAPSLARADQPAPTGEVVATAAGQPASPSEADSTLSRWLGDAPPVNGEGDDGVLTLGDDRKVHGEVGFGIGTGGYRDGFAAVSLPVGQTGRLGVAVQDTQYGKPWRYEQRSLDVNLSLGAGAAPTDCATPIRVGGRYVEPLWVSNFRGSALQDVDSRCAAPDPARR